MKKFPIWNAVTKTILVTAFQIVVFLNFFFFNLREGEKNCARHTHTLICCSTYLCIRWLTAVFALTGDCTHHLGNTLTNGATWPGHNCNFLQHRLCVRGPSRLRCGFRPAHFGCLGLADIFPQQPAGCIVGEKRLKRTKVTQSFRKVGGEGAFACSAPPHSQLPMGNSNGCGKGGRALLNGWGLHKDRMQLNVATMFKQLFNTAWISIQVLCFCKTTVPGRARIALYPKRIALMGCIDRLPRNITMPTELGRDQLVR